MGGILGILWVHLGYILCIFWAHFEHVLGILLGIFCEYDGDIFGTSWVYHMAYFYPILN